MCAARVSTPGPRAARPASPRRSGARRRRRRRRARARRRRASARAPAPDAPQPRRPCATAPPRRARRARPRPRTSAGSIDAYARGDGDQRVDRDRVAATRTDSTGRPSSTDAPQQRLPAPDAHDALDAARRRGARAPTPAGTPCARRTITTGGRARRRRGVGRRAPRPGRRSSAARGRRAPGRPDRSPPSRARPPRRPGDDQQRAAASTPIAHRRPRLRPHLNGAT